MRIVVDTGLCQGHAMCEVEAPDVFRAPPGGPVEVLMPDIPPDQEDLVRAAVRFCPTRALSLEED
jgi:ferredoxin